MYIEDLKPASFWQRHSPEIHDSLVLIGCVKHNFSNTCIKTALQNTVGLTRDRVPGYIRLLLFWYRIQFCLTNCWGEEGGRKQLFC